MPESEATLLARYAREQDAEAFRELIERHKHMVYAVCRRMLGNRADAEDATQDCFFTLTRHAERLRSPIGGWLHRVAVTTCIDHLRSERARKAREEKVAERRLAQRGELSWDDIKDEVDHAIAALPEKLRTPLVLYYLESERQEDIAEELGISQSGVSQRVQKAVEEVRKRLRKRGVRVSAGVLGPLLMANATEVVPASLSSALGMMAIAGPGTAASAGGVAAAVGLVAGAVVFLGLLIAALVHLLSSEPPTDGGVRRRPLLNRPLAGRPAPRPFAFSEETAQTPPTPPVDPPAVTLLGKGTGKDMFLDLDAGALASMQPGAPRLEDLAEQMRRNGTDVLYEPVLDRDHLIACDLNVVQWPVNAEGVPGPAFFESDEFRRSARDGFPLMLRVGESHPHAYAFETREGGRGVLRVRRAGPGERGVVVERILLSTHPGEGS